MGFSLPEKDRIFNRVVAGEGHSMNETGEPGKERGLRSISSGILPGYLLR
jgi:hypothetical protein